MSFWNECLTVNKDMFEGEKLNLLDALFKGLNKENKEILECIKKSFNNKENESNSTIRKDVVNSFKKRQRVKCHENVKCLLNFFDFFC